MGVCDFGDLHCRPREGGDPYAVSSRCGKACVKIAAFAGTTTERSQSCDQIETAELNDSHPLSMPRQSAREATMKGIVFALASAFAGIWAAAPATSQTSN